MTEDEFLKFLQDLISTNIEKGFLTVCEPIRDYFKCSDCSGLFIRLKNGNKFLLPLVKIYNGSKN